MTDSFQAPLRIVHLLDTDNFAGTERYVLQQLLGLRATGAHPILACRDGGLLHRAATDHGIETWPVWRGGGRLATYRGYRSLKMRLKREPVDLLQAHNGRTMLIAARLAGKTPAIGTQHFLEPKFASYRGLKRLLASTAHRWVNHRLAHVICVSDAAKSAMIRRERIASSKLTTVHSGIDPVEVPDPSRIAALRRSFAIGDGRLLIVCVARLEAEKSVGDLVAAMPAEIARQPAAKLLVAGDGVLRPALQTQIDSLGLTGYVSLLGYRSDALDLIAACDVLVLPSAVESFGMVLLEAMALGKPVVACRAGGPAEVVADGVTGLLVPPGDPPELATAVALLLNDAHLRERMSSAAVERFRSHFTSARMMQGILQVYRSVLAQRIQVNDPASLQPTS